MVARTTTLPVLTLAAILLLALVLRLPLPGLTPPGLWYDEALDAQDAAAVWAPGGAGLQWVYPDVFPRETIYTTTLALVTRLAGPRAEVLRWVSVAYGLLAVGLLYGMLQCAWGSGGAGPALCAAAVLATMRWHATFSVLIFRTITLPALLVGLTWAVLAWQRRPSSARALLAGALLGLGFHTYLAWYFMLPYAAALIGWMAWRLLRRGAPWIHGAWLLGGLLLVAGPLALHYLRYPEHLLARPQAVSVFSNGWGAALGEIGKNLRDALLMFHWRGDHVPKHNIPWRPALDVLQGLGLLLGLAACVRAWRRGHHSKVPGRPLAALLPLWIACGLLATIFTKTDSPNTLRTLCVTPAVAALVGLGYWRATQWTARLWAGARGRAAVAWRTGLLLVLLILTSAATTAQGLYRTWARNEEVWRSFNGDLYDLGRLAAAAPPDVAVFVPQYLWQHRTFQYLTLGARARIYPYASWAMLDAWPPAGPSDAVGEGPPVLARAIQPAGPPPRERWIIVTANNRILQALEPLTPSGRVAGELQAPSPERNTWALAWAVPERALPTPAQLAPLTAWRGEMRF